MSIGHFVCVCINELNSRSINPNVFLREIISFVSKEIDSMPFLLLQAMFYSKFQKFHQPVITKSKSFEFFRFRKSIQLSVEDDFMSSSSMWCVLYVINQYIPASGRGLTAISTYFSGIFIYISG